MSNAVLAKKVQELASRVRLLEGLRSVNKGVSSSWAEIIATKPRLRQMEEERRAKILEKTAGALKNKLPKNSVAWQRKVRSEWT